MRQELTDEEKKLAENLLDNIKSEIQGKMSDKESEKLAENIVRKSDKESGKLIEKIIKLSKEGLTEEEITKQITNDVVVFWLDRPVVATIQAY